MNSFQFSGLPLEDFQFLFNFSDAELASHGAQRCIVDSKPGYPCRVSLADAEIGESVILLNYVHHPVDGPYRSSGPVYVRETATQVIFRVNEVPPVVRDRLMSVRAYDSNGYLVRSDVVEGSTLEHKIPDFFSDASVAYLHLHNAKPGCYSCRVDRA
jgi:hypothetical protein